MNKRVILGCLLAVSVGACGGGGGDVDAATPADSGPDTGPVDAGPIDAYLPDAGPPATAAVAAGNTLDMSCLGTATRPAGGAATMGTLTVNEFLNMSATANTTIDIFTNDTIADTCAAPDCISVTTDASGMATATAPLGALVAYHIHPSDATAEVLAYGFPWGASNRTAAFSSGTISTVSALLGRTLDRANAGAISGQVTDCMGHSLANVEPRVFHGADRVVTGPSQVSSSPRIVGLEGTSPTRGPGFFTGASGQFVGANVPTGDDYHVEVWGVLTDGGNFELIGCEEGRVVAGGITVLSIGPLRGDYPAGSACDAAATAAGH